jgi:hypothetical protein
VAAPDLRHGQRGDEKDLRATPASRQVDQARIDNFAKLAEELTERGTHAIDTIVDAIGHLGPDHAAVKALGKDMVAAEMAKGQPTDHWAPLVTALNDLAEHNRSKAYEKRNPRARVSTQARSERALFAAEAQARPFDELVRLLEAVADKRKVLDVAKNGALGASPSAGELSADRFLHQRAAVLECDARGPRRAQVPGPLPRNPQANF